MITAEALLVATLATPLAMLSACVSRRMRDRMPALLGLAPVPAFAAALLAPGSAPLVLFPPPLRMTLTLDVPAAMLLGAAALLWIVAGVYAATYMRGSPNAARFAEWWLLTLTGSLGVFMAADLVSFYLTYSIVSLSAYGLVVHDGTAAVRRAGAVYVALAVLGEAFLLMAFVFMAEATPNGSLLIRDAVAALPASPWRDASLALLILGFGLKIGTRSGACVDAACLHRGADPRRRRAQRRRRKGRRDRVDPLSASWYGDAGLGRSTGRRGIVFGVLWRRARYHAGQSEDRPGLFERQSDGVARGGARHGVGSR